MAKSKFADYIYLPCQYVFLCHSTYKTKIQGVIFQVLTIKWADEWMQMYLWTKKYREYTVQTVKILTHLYIKLPTRTSSWLFGGPTPDHSCLGGGSFSPQGHMHALPGEGLTSGSPNGIPMLAREVWGAFSCGMLWSNCESPLVVPWMRIAWGDRRFQAAVLCLWNMLPISVKQMESLSGFESHLKTHLFTTAIWWILQTHSDLLKHVF